MYRDQLRRNGEERRAVISRRRRAIKRWQDANQQITTANYVPRYRKKRKKKKKRRGRTPEERDRINARRHNRKRRQSLGDGDVLLETRKRKGKRRGTIRPGAGEDMAAAVAAHEASLAAGGLQRPMSRQRLLDALHAQRGAAPPPSQLSRSATVRVDRERRRSSASAAEAWGRVARRWRSPRHAINAAQYLHRRHEQRQQQRARWERMPEVAVGFGGMFADAIESRALQQRQPPPPRRTLELSETGRLGAMPTETVMGRSPSGHDIFDFSDSSSGED